MQVLGLVNSPHAFSCTMPSLSEGLQFPVVSQLPDNAECDGFVTVVISYVILSHPEQFSSFSNLI